MAKYVAVAKAAKSLGVKRSMLQSLIRQGDLRTFEGLVDLEELENHFPAIRWEQAPMVERARIIRDNAYSHRVQSALFTQKESLETQIKRLRVDLSVHKAKEDVYRNIIVELMDRLGQLQQMDSQHRQIAEELNCWLLQQFKNSQADES